MMVQAALASAVPLIAGAGSAALGAFQGQGRRQISRTSPESSLPAILAAPDMKRAKYISKEADKERLINFLSQPEILGLVMTLLGIYASQKINFSDNDLVNEGIQATATTASVLIGLGLAGVGDLTTAVVAGLAGITSLADALDFSLIDLNVGDLLPWNGFLNALKGIGVDI